MTCPDTLGTNQKGKLETRSVFFVPGWLSGPELVARGTEDLRALAAHALEREFPEQLLQRKHADDAATGTAAGAAAAAAAGAAATAAASSDAQFRAELLGMARAAAQKFAQLGAEWVRIGYTQSNFNADNCLISGATVDYGPFGFIEKCSAPPISFFSLSFSLYSVLCCAVLCCAVLCCAVLCCAELC